MPDAARVMPAGVVPAGVVPAGVVPANPAAEIWPPAADCLEAEQSYRVVLQVRFSLRVPGPRADRCVHEGG
jgi:hypothetical protein